MKNLHLTLLASCILSLASGQYTWLEMAAFPTGLVQSNAFTVGGMGYIVGGETDAGVANAVNYVYQYNPNTNAWITKSNYPINTGISGVFVINDTAYIIGGNTGNDTYVNNSYQYNAGNDSWTQIASYPESSIAEVFSFSINGIGYICAGSNGWASTAMYAYNPSTNSWTSKAIYPGPPTIDGISFVLDSFAYAGMGWEGSGTAYNNMYKYDPSTDSWTGLNPFPGIPRISATAFVLNGTAYVAGGLQFINGCRVNFSDCYQYNPSSDTWTAVPGFLSLPRWAPASFAIGNVAYLTGGLCDYNDSVFNSTYAFGPCNSFGQAAAPERGNQQLDVQAYPNPASGNMNIRVSGSSDDKFQYKLFSVDGQLVLHGSEQQNDFAISTSHLQDVVYVLQLTDGQGVQGIKRIEVIH